MIHEYNELKSENECKECVNVKKTQDATIWEKENLKDGYGGVFWCMLLNRIVNPWGNCKGFTVK